MPESGKIAVPKIVETVHEKPVTAGEMEGGKGLEVGSSVVGGWELEHCKAAQVPDTCQQECGMLAY